MIRNALAAASLVAVGGCASAAPATAPPMTDSFIEARCAAIPGDTTDWCPQVLSTTGQFAQDNGCMAPDGTWIKPNCSGPAPEPPVQVIEAMVRWASSAEGHRYLEANPNGREFFELIASSCRESGDGSWTCPES